MTEEIIEMHLIFIGHVHGVGFRVTSATLANEMGLKGSVRNLHDGTVEVLIQGSRYSLNQFIENLKKHFDKKIHQVIVDDNKTLEKPYNDFKILF